MKTEKGLEVKSVFTLDILDPHDYFFTFAREEMRGKKKKKELDKVSCLWILTT